MRNYKIIKAEFEATPRFWQKYKDMQDPVFHLNDGGIKVGNIIITLDNGDIIYIDAGVRAVGECSMYDTKGEFDMIYNDDVAEIAKDDKGLAAMANEKGWEWQNNPWYVFDFYCDIDLTPEYMDEVVFSFDEAEEYVGDYVRNDKDFLYDMLDKLLTKAE